MSGIKSYSKLFEIIYNLKEMGLIDDVKTEQIIQELDFISSKE